MGATTQLDTANAYMERVGAAVRQGNHTVSALRFMSQHPKLFLDDFSGLGPDEVQADSKRLYDSAQRVQKMCEMAQMQIVKEASNLRKKEPSSNMTYFGKQIISWLIGIAHCAYNAPNGTLRGYADDLRIAVHPLDDETAVNNAFALLIESSIQL